MVMNSPFAFPLVPLDSPRIPQAESDDKRRIVPLSQESLQSILPAKAPQFKPESPAIPPPSTLNPLRLNSNHLEDGCPILSTFAKLQTPRTPLPHVFVFREAPNTTNTRSPSFPVSRSSKHHEHPCPIHSTFFWRMGGKPQPPPGACHLERSEAKSKDPRLPFNLQTNARKRVPQVVVVSVPILRHGKPRFRIGHSLKGHDFSRAEIAQARTGLQPLRDGFMSN